MTLALSQRTRVSEIIGLAWAQQQVELLQVLAPVYRSLPVTLATSGLGGYPSVPHPVVATTATSHFSSNQRRWVSGPAPPTPPPTATDKADKKRAYQNEKGRTFVDLRRVLVRSGAGGKGLVAWRRNSGERKFQPHGADGGRGGDVVFVASPRITTLAAVPVTINGGRGHHAKGKGLVGTTGETATIEVPLGTAIWHDTRRKPSRPMPLAPNTTNPDPATYEDDDSDLFDEDEDEGFYIDIDADGNEVVVFGARPTAPPSPDDHVGAAAVGESENRAPDPEPQLAADLVDEGDTFVAAVGGSGGRGNGGPSQTRVEQKDDPRTLGTPGEERFFRLELKTIADVGLVGLPNAGKSTFLGAVSRAHPKVAAYPFTTLNPHLGVVEFSDHARFTIADIPGLALGAADNVGLGHSFLRHIERSRVLLYLVDASCEPGVMPPRDALDALRAELHAYNPELATRPALVAATKLDFGAPAIGAFRELQAHTELPTLGLSSATGHGVRGATTALLAMVERLRVEHDRRRPPQSMDDVLFGDGHSASRRSKQRRD